MNSEKSFANEFINHVWRSETGVIILRCGSKIDFKISKNPISVSINFGINNDSGKRKILKKKKALHQNKTTKGERALLERKATKP